jgi:hypothetical protein
MKSNAVSSWPASAARADASTKGQNPGSVGRTSLHRPEAYLEQIDVLLHKLRTSPFRRPLERDGLPLTAVGAHAHKLAALLAREVSDGTFRLGPLERTSGFIDGKWRTLYRPGLLEAIVLGAVGRRLADLAEPLLSDHVVSYRRGRSSWQAIAAFQAFVSRHRAERPDPRARGLYVIVRDVARYGDSVPTDDRSRLWPLLEGVVARAPDATERSVLNRLVRAAARPEVSTPEGSVRLQVGLPTGSPIQQPLCNLYLTPADHELSELPRSFYVRFGDDLLFCCAELEVAVQASQRIDALMRELRLELKPAARHDLYFTGSGRPACEHQPLALRGTSFVEHLGVRMAFEGGLGLKVEKARKLVRNIRWRIDLTCRLLPRAEWLEAVCETVRAALDPSHPLCEPSAGLLRAVVDDRRQLKQLDYAIALMCAERLTRTRGVRAFRTMPYRKLRNAGLPSLVVAKNRALHQRSQG